MNKCKAGGEKDGGLGQAFMGRLELEMNDLGGYLVLEDIHVIWRKIWMALGTFSMEAYLLGHLLGMKYLVTPRSIFS
jgi:hypothetical protein